MVAVLLFDKEDMKVFLQHTDIWFNKDGTGKMVILCRPACLGLPPVDVKDGAVLVQKPNLEMLNWAIERGDWDKAVKFLEQDIMRQWKEEMIPAEVSFEEGS